MYEIESILNKIKAAINPFEEIVREHIDKQTLYYSCLFDSKYF